MAEETPKQVEDRVKAYQANYNMKTLTSALDKHTNELTSHQDVLTRNMVVMNHVSDKQGSLVNSMGTMPDLSKEIELLNETAKSHTNHIIQSTEKLDSSVTNMSDMMIENEKKHSAFLEKLKTAGKIAAVGAVAGATYYGFRSAKTLGWDMPKAALTAPFKAAGGVYRASGVQEGLAKAERITSEDVGQTKTDFAKLAITGISGGLLGSAGSDILTGPLKKLFGGDRGGAREAGDSWSYGGTKEKVGGLFSGMGEFLDDRFGTSKGSRAFEMKPNEELSTEFGSMNEALTEQNELMDVQLSGGRTGKRPQTLKAKRIMRMQERGKPMGQAKTIVDGMGQQFDKGVSGWASSMIGGFGLKQILGWTIRGPWGGAYRSELPSTKHGVFNAMNQTLGMIYTSTRFMSDEMNGLLMQIGEFIRQGFGIEGKMKAPKGRSLAQMIGGVIRGKILGALSKDGRKSKMMDMANSVRAGVMGALGAASGAAMGAAGMSASFLGGIANKGKDIFNKGKDSISGGMKSLFNDKGPGSILGGLKETISNMLPEWLNAGIKQFTTIVSEWTITPILEAFNKIVRSLGGIPDSYKEELKKYDVDATYIHKLIAGTKAGAKGAGGALMGAGVGALAGFGALEAAKFGLHLGAIKGAEGLAAKLPGTLGVGTSKALGRYGEYVKLPLDLFESVVAGGQSIRSKGIKEAGKTAARPLTRFGGNIKGDFSDISDWAFGQKMPSHKDAEVDAKVMRGDGPRNLHSGEIVATPESLKDALSKAFIPTEDKLDKIIKILGGAKVVTTGKLGVGGILGSMIKLPFTITGQLVKRSGQLFGAAIKPFAQAVSIGLKTTSGLITNGFKMVSHTIRVTANATVSALRAGFNHIGGIFSAGWAVISSPFKAIGFLLNKIISKPLQWVKGMLGAAKDKIKTMLHGEVIGVAPDGTELRTKYGWQATYLLLERTRAEQFEIGVKTFSLLKRTFGKDDNVISSMKLNFKHGGYKDFGSASKMWDMMKGAIGKMSGTLMSGLGIIAGGLGIKSGLKIFGKGGATVAAKEAGKLAAKVAAGPKAAVKGLGGIVAGLGGKIGAKSVAKLGGKGILKGLGKAIPGIGLLISAGFAINKITKGDWIGAAMEMAAGAMGTFPGIGTAGMVAMETAIAAREYGNIGKHRTATKSMANADNLPTTFAAHGAIGDFGTGAKAVLHGKEAVIPLSDPIYADIMSVAKGDVDSQIALKTATNRGLVSEFSGVSKGIEGLQAGQQATLAIMNNSNVQSSVHSSGGDSGGSISTMDATLDNIFNARFA